MPYYQGDYYMAGGFFGKLFGGLKKAAKFVGGVAKAALPVVSSFIPGIGGVVGGLAGRLLSSPVGQAGQAIGRVAQMFNSPSAAPSGIPMEGSTPGGYLYSRGTYGAGDQRYLAAAVGRGVGRPLRRTRRPVRRRRRRY